MLARKTTSLLFAAALTLTAFGPGLPSAVAATAAHVRAVPAGLGRAGTAGAAAVSLGTAASPLGPSLGSRLPGSLASPVPGGLPSPSLAVPAAVRSPQLHAGAAGIFSAPVPGANGAPSAHIAAIPDRSPAKRSSPRSFRAAPPDGGAISRGRGPGPRSLGIGASFRAAASLARRLASARSRTAAEIKRAFDGSESREDAAPIVLLEDGASLALSEVDAGVSPERAAEILKALSARAGLRVPSLETISSFRTNAAAYKMGRKITVTTGLLGMLTERELASVLAHELGHLHRGTLRVAGYVALPPILVQATLTFALWPLAFPFNIPIAGIFAMATMYWGVTRYFAQEEFTADAFSKRLMGDGRVLAETLAKLRGRDPAVPERIRRLTD